MAKQSTAPKTAADPSQEADAERSRRAEESVQAFRDALDKSVTISRERLQEVVDDAVRRGRMTRGDAEELVSRLITRGREQAQDILGELERLLGQVRGGVEAASTPRRTARKATRRAQRDLEGATERARQEVGGRAKRARKRAVGAVDQPLAGADRVRRRAKIPGFPITAYDSLTIGQIDRRLTELTRAELTKVRKYEQSNKARKGLLRAIDRKLEQ
jgi:polyhydroxyalkanoate synthesis regulator phasin